MDNSDDSDEDPGGCVGKAKELFRPDSKASADFKLGEIPLLGQALGRYESPEAASTNLNETFGAYLACEEFMFMEGLETYSGTIDELSFPQFGDELRAFASNIDADGITIGVNVVLLRAENIVATFIYIDLGPPVTEDVQQLVRTAYEKLEQ